MQFSDKLVQEMKDLSKRKGGKEMSDGEANEALNNLAGLAEIFIECAEEEHQRKEKLKESPEGFILEGIGRNCAICGNSSTAEGSWYDEYGIKCLICQDAIKRKEIPPSLAKSQENRYSKYELESYFNLSGPTLREWIEKGIINARTITRDGKKIYTQLFLIKDNKDFLPPKKLVKSQMIKETKDGKDWFSCRPWYQFIDPHEHLKGYKIMEYLRVVPTEKMKAREEEEKKKWEEKRVKK